MQLIRPAIVENVVKVLSCRTPLLGYHLYRCSCSAQKKIPHSCKSRFCTSCGKKATDNWIANALKTLPHVRYQHITFTLPDVFWDLFRMNRYLIGEIPRIAAHTVLKICKEGKKRKHYLPGIFLAIHSYGRDLKYNIHIHLSTTVGGFSIQNPQQYIQGSTIDHQVIKNMWKYQIIKLLRDYFKKGLLLPYPEIKQHFLNLTTFNKWIDPIYQKKWVVNLQKTQKDSKPTVEYLGKYLKKPPLAETRIIAYDGNSVTFRFLDHHTKTYQTKTMMVFDFIKALISHIPDKYFRMIRYFGFFANRVRTKYLQLLKPEYKAGSPIKISHVQLSLKTFGTNPLKCSCGKYFHFCRMIFALPLRDLIHRHNIKVARLHAT